jgi:hypothetical protein
MFWGIENPHQYLGHPLYAGGHRFVTGVELALRSCGGAQWA